MSDIVERLRRTLSDLPGNDDDLFNEIHAQRDEAADEIERLREALRDVNAVLFQARMYRGYEGGPLAMPFASYAEDRARAALGEEKK
jgi:DNA topoisomerase IB